MRSRPDWHELLVTYAGFFILAALTFGPHIAHGGFYLDDWRNAAYTFYPAGGPGAGNALSLLADVGIYRPVLVIYVPAVYWIFGMHVGLHLAWATTLAVLVAGLFYGVLRTLEVPRIHAWIIAALTIVYPWSDATRLWATADQISVSMAFALGGLWIALAGLRSRSWRWHIAASGLYLLSILTYEVTLPLIVAAGALYVARAGWQVARVRWAMDLLATGAGAIWVGTRTARTTSDLSDSLSHLWEIVTNGGTILGRTVLPLGTQRTTLAVCFVVAVLAAGVAMRWLSPKAGKGSIDWQLGNWLLLGGVGLFVTACGWVMFIPADPYYTPSIFGITNRVNGLAAFGLVMTIYAVFGVIGELARRLRLATNAGAVVLTLILAASLGAAYVHVIRRHTTIWRSAYILEQAGIKQIREKYPELPSETTLFVGGYPAYQTLGVPIFSSTWDLDGMMKMEYEDSSVAAFPILPGMRLICQADGLQLFLEGERGDVVPYGKARLLNLEAGLRSVPRTQGECVQVLGRYVPGPLYLSTGY